MGSQNAYAHPHTKKLLFLTNSESGQSNIVLATALEALTRPHVEVHVGSFPVLKRRVEKLDPRLNFHALDGKPADEIARGRGFSVGDAVHPPLRKCLLVDERIFWIGYAAWDGESEFPFPPGVGDVSDGILLAYMRIFQSTVKLIEELNPTLVVVEGCFSPGFDACYSTNRMFVMCSPNAPLDITRVHQPWLKGFWYYPLFVSLPDQSQTPN